MTAIADLVAPLKKMRLKSGLTQADVAKVMGVTPAAVSFLESGRQVRLDTLLGYAAAVDGELAVIRRRDRLELRA